MENKIKGYCRICEFVHQNKNLVCECKLTQKEVFLNQTCDCYKLDNRIKKELKI